MLVLCSDFFFLKKSPTSKLLLWKVLNFSAGNSNFNNKNKLVGTQNISHHQAVSSPDWPCRVTEALCPRDAGRCLEVLQKVYGRLGSTFLYRNKEVLCHDFPCRGWGLLEGSEIWNFLPGWSIELRQVGPCHVPPGAGANSSGRLLLDYSSASRNVKVPRGYHSATQRKEEDSIPSLL
jgi:hypothetical protein